MTKDEALKMAIKVLRMDDKQRHNIEKTIQACKKALEQPTQEPKYLYVYYDLDKSDFDFWDKPLEPDYDELMERREYFGKIKLEVDD